MSKLSVQTEKEFNVVLQKEMTVVYITDGVQLERFGYGLNSAETFLVMSRAKKEIQKFNEK